MVIFDVVVHSPMIYFPTYYTLKEFVGGHKWNPTDWVKDGLAKYRANALEDLAAMVKVTIPSGKFVLCVYHVHIEAANLYHMIVAF